MMRPHPNPVDEFASGGDQAVDLLDAIKAFETELDLDPGSVTRSLTDLIRRRQKFESLKRDYDVRLRYLGGSSWHN